MIFIIVEILKFEIINCSQEYNVITFIKFMKFRSFHVQFMLLKQPYFVCVCFLRIRDCYLCLCCIVW